MVILCIIAGALFIYSVAITVHSWKQADLLLGTLEIAPGTDETEPPYVFLNIDVPPSELQNGAYVTFKVHRVQPRK